MKRILLAIIVACCGLMVNAQEQPNVLFIGNSYTDVNNLPGLIDSVAASAGHKYTYRSNTPGGCTFQQHCQNESMQLINQGGWDYVVLQEQSQLPSFPQSQVENQCFPFAWELSRAIKNAGGRPMFYMTWGRKDGDPQNAQYFPPLGTYEGMDSLLYERYMYMATTNEASVCPVGRVWRYIRENHSEIELYASDGSHPSMAGSYAAACAFFAMIFNDDPLNITFTGNVEPEHARTIRQVAHDIVYNNYGMWYDPANYDPNGGEGIADVDEVLISVYPNPTAGLFEVGAGIDFEVVDLAGRVVLRGQGQGNASQLGAGTYVVRLSQNGQLIATRKLIRKAN